MATTYGNTDVARTLTLTRTEPAGLIAAPSALERSQNVTMSCVVTFPSTVSDGCLYETGGTGIGAFVGIVGSQFTVAAGDGAPTVSNSIAAIFKTTNFPADDKPHLVAWDFAVNPGRVRLWIDSLFIGEESTTTGGPLESADWAGTDSGGYTVASTSVVVAGTLTPWPGTAITDLKIYTNQLVPL